MLIAHWKTVVIPPPTPNHKKWKFSQPKEGGSSSSRGFFIASTVILYLSLLSFVPLLSEVALKMKKMNLIFGIWYSKYHQHSQGSKLIQRPFRGTNKKSLYTPIYHGSEWYIISSFGLSTVQNQILNRLIPPFHNPSFLDRVEGKG